MRNNRIYYRNPFFHIGHLQTLLFNDQYATANGGKCYAIVDDRYHLDYKSKIQADFDYLNLQNTILVPITDYAEIIRTETHKLITGGKIFMLCGKQVCTHADYIRACLDASGLTVHFQLKLKNDDTTIGFTKDDQTVYLFEYIIKLLDNYLNITDITSDLVIHDACVNLDQLSTRKINIIPLKLYSIDGFRYVKKHWPTDALYDPCLLTLKGLKARGVPREVLHAFYTRATEMKTVPLALFDEILRDYLPTHSSPLRAVIDPLRVVLEAGAGEIYISKSDFGMDCPTKLIKNRSCNLRDTAEQITCTAIMVNEKGLYEIHAVHAPGVQPNLRTIHWLPDHALRKARFKCYNWYYTGYNEVMKPVIYEGYIEAGVDVLPGVTYYLPRTGYCCLTDPEPDGVICFIFICKV